jgi:hypothetical protein
MQIQAVDALKIWLVEMLEPICDADPAALAKYVMALVKKDKSLEELKALCEDQLEVFLAEETKSFVAQLFNILETKTYITPEGPAIAPSEEVVTSTVIEKNDDGEQKGKKRKEPEEESKEGVEKVQKTNSLSDVTTNNASPEEDKNIRRSRRLSSRTADTSIEDGKTDEPYDESVDSKKFLRL